MGPAPRIPNLNNSASFGNIIFSGKYCATASERGAQTGCGRVERVTCSLTRPCGPPSPLDPWRENNTSKDFGIPWRAAGGEEFVSTGARPVEGIFALSGPPVIRLGSSCGWLKAESELLPAPADAGTTLLSEKLNRTASLEKRREFRIERPVI